VRPLLARITVLVSGAAILVVETLATRLVAPYVGLTLESTTAVIGVALAGIAAGAALGGRWATSCRPAGSRRSGSPSVASACWRSGRSSGCSARCSAPVPESDVLTDDRAPADRLATSDRTG
jgi:hypothetical protein